MTQGKGVIEHPVLVELRAYFGDVDWEWEDGTPFPARARLRVLSEHIRALEAAAAQQAPTERGIVPTMRELRGLLDGTITVLLRPVTEERKRKVNGVAPFAPCPLGTAGETVYVQEDVMLVETATADPLTRLTAPVHYLADGPAPTLDERHDAGLLRFVPAADMPSWAARLKLRIMEVRPAGLHDLTPGEIWATGAKPATEHGHDDESGRSYCRSVPAHDQLAGQWNAQYRGELAYETNPWVWLVVVERAPAPTAA